jgi:hypothetical protein
MVLNNKAMRISFAGAFLLLAACIDDGSIREAVDTATVTASSLPFVYVGQSTDVHERRSTPEAAYAAAQAAVRTACGGNESCIDSRPIAISPLFNNIDWDQQVPVRGFAALVDDCIGAAQQVRSLTTSSTFPAGDAEATLEALDDWMQTVKSWSSRNGSRRTALLATINDVPSRLAEAGSAVHGAESARLAQNRTNLDQITRLVETHELALAGLAPQYDALADSYRAYHATDVEIGSLLSEVATEASEADGDELATRLQQLVTISTNETSHSVDLQMSVARLNSEVGYEIDKFTTAVAPYTDFIAREGVALPTAGERTVTLLESMQRYLRMRQQRQQQYVVSLVRAIRRRQEALLLLAVDIATRETVATQMRAEAAARYVEDTTQLVDATWADPPIVNGFALLTARFDRVNALTQSASLCSDADKPRWMDSGCIVLARNVSKANAYLGTLPRVLRRSRDRLQAAGAPAHAIAVLTSTIDAGDLAQAVAIHDTIANQTGRGQ